jgi:hypothetical protein
MPMPHIEINTESVANALTTADFDRPSSDITNSVSQEAIADSILDAPIVGDHRRLSVDTVSDERIFEEWPNQQVDFELEGEQPEQEPEQLETEGQEFADDELNQILDEAQASIRDEAQPEVLTPAEIAQNLQQLDAAITEHQLVDPMSAQALANDLTLPYGGDPRQVDSNLLGSAMAKTVVSALQIFDSCQGDPSKINENTIPPAAANLFTSEVLRSFGIDPRLTSVDSMHLARVALGGMLNFVSTVNEHGLDTSMDRLNSPEAAQWFGNEVNKAFGINEPMDRQAAIALADGFGRFAVGVMQRLKQVNPPTEVRQSRSRPKPSSRFRSNRDLFDNEGEALYRSRKGRL